jgi:outer membrane protein OmpU
MKKVLIATTALVATAGMAAAELKFGGSARFGVQYFEDADDEIQVHNRFTLNIDGTAETDTGLEFFARVRIRGGNTGNGTAAVPDDPATPEDESAPAVGPSASGVSAPRVGVRAGGLTVAVGNINGALESTPGLYGGAVGLTGLGWGNLPINASASGQFDWDSFSSSGGGSNGVEVIYSGNGFGAHLSHSGTTGRDRTAVHLSYAFSDWTVGLGHQESDGANEDLTVLTVGGSLGSFDVGLKYASNEGDNDAVTIWGSADIGAATTVTAYATLVDSDAVRASSGLAVEDSYGIGFTHSLGGATLAGGVARTLDDQTVADFGVRFNF